MCMIRNLRSILLAVTFFKKFSFSREVMAHALNPSTLEAEAGDLCEFEASLVYKASSRTARATQRNLSKEQKEEKKEIHFLIILNLFDH